MSGRVYIIGGGLSGLSAALCLVRRGVIPIVCEAGGQAGGRCRSYRDPVLRRALNNGSHLVLGANREVFSYLRLCGAEHTLRAVPQKGIPFYDLTDDCQWTLRVGLGAALAWPFDRRRIPGVGLGAILGDLYRLRRATGTVSQALGDVDGPLFRRFWLPLCVAILNTHPDRAAAALLWAVLERTLLKGSGASRLFLPVRGLSETFVDPALVAIRRLRGEVRLHTRLRAVSHGPTGLESLKFRRGAVRLDVQDRVIFALPPYAVKHLVVGIDAPEGDRAIVNVHFDTPAYGGEAHVCAIVGGMGEWVFSQGDTTSVTLSDADARIGMEDSDLAGRVWTNVARAQNISGSMGRYRIVREKRATFLQSPQNERRRPGVTTPLGNLFLAGDWTNTGLPATIEGALLSGRWAAEAVLRSFER
ncbi:hydroxysqualene dehydroxylase HpnE [Varunaivibrio sulfuroxidans]|uniref:Squalene-associated FAD-dependent desaturase n=1 Tax=Varunaivibrio sulfuroxidans TaxID=1773489 RepID=A0A4R3J9U4_9PROT|nr:hydroxysqualene dehydroxylase HpnE [Varunaivibrio sulfuroxidans]TCS61360.1 squalene-associated FAD-dependent desaturase [Varunaivibrio sulfuroxidans]WES31028.1 hydroxysqualene dehydroxylase HpnE [Varunaivibrio sulfuroxidans]